MNREDRQIDKEYPQRDREFMQQIVDMLIPGLKLPDPEETVRKAYADPSPATYIEAYAEAVEKSEALKSEDNRTTLGLQGFKQRELHTVMWALREFADAAGIELHNGIKERYDAERKTYGISLRFYKK